MKTPLHSSMVNEYLQAGGLFNPDLMNHEQVRDMIIELNTKLNISMKIINTYACHKPGCKHNSHLKYEYTVDCTCGLANILKELLYVNK